MYTDCAFFFGPNVEFIGMKRPKMLALRGALRIGSGNYPPHTNRTPLRRSSSPSKRRHTFFGWEVYARAAEGPPGKALGPEGGDERGNALRRPGPKPKARTSLVSLASALVLRYYPGGTPTPINGGTPKTRSPAGHPRPFQSGDTQDPKSKRDTHTLPGGHPSPCEAAHPRPDRGGTPMTLFRLLLSCSTTPTTGGRASRPARERSKDHQHLSRGCQLVRPTAPLISETEPNLTSPSE